MPNLPILLLVDDEPDFLEVLKNLLEPRGYRCLLAGSGHQALEILEQETIDLVLTDIRMPGMNGLQLLEQVSKRWPNILRMVLSGYADKDNAVDAINLGHIQAYLEKPVQSASLLREVADAMRGKQRREQEIRQTEEYIHLVEAQFRTMFEQAAVGVAQIITNTGEFIRINKKYCDIIGYSQEEMIKRTYQSITHEEDLQTDLDNLQLLREGKIREFSMEKRYIHKNGSHVWVNLTVSPMWQPGEAPDFHIAIVEDITERKQAEEILKRYQHIVFSSNDFLSYLDKDYRYLAVNDTYLETFNMTREEFIGKHAEELFGKEKFKQIKPYMERCLSGEAVNFEISLNFPAKEIRAFDVHYDPHLGSDGAVEGIVINVRDITERKQAEEILRRYQHIVFSSSDFLSYMDKNYRYLAVNDTYLEAYNVSREELIGKHAGELFGEEDFKQIKPYIERCLSGESVNYEISLNFPAKGNRTLDVHHDPHLGSDGAVEGIVINVRDITERKKAEEELLKLSRAVESSTSAVVMTDLDGNIEYINPKFTEVTGYAKEDVLGKNPRILQSGETPETVYADLWETITSGGEWKGEFYDKRKNGSFYWVRTSITGVKNATGETTHYIGIQDDVTHEHELSEQLSYQASHDALTGLINRHEFKRRAERLLSTIRQDQDEHALCFMDLDQFKVVNDTCGHTAGDELLRQLGSVLQNAVRHRDTLARLGGDEFGVLMEHCSLDHAHRVARSLQEAIQGYQFIWEEHTFRVGVSIGLVAITETTPNLTELLKQADAACYMAKDLGRNRIHVYHGEDASLARRHGEMQWVARIYQALEEHRFCLYAQTIVPLDSRHDKHYELLLRMEDEKGGIILPGAFLPAAERYNLITQLDVWVIENAFTLLAANPIFLKQIHFISINLSGQSLTKHDFLDFIISQLDVSGIKGEKICFEITETAAIANLSTAIKFISTLKELGCRFALDDFGSGLSSFRYLKNLPVDYLKIDGMFVKNIVDDPIDHAMVKSINEIGQVMGMQTIAEFVENDVIKGMLKEIGVNYVQGYGIGKPLAFDELLGRSNSVANIKDA